MRIFVKKIHIKLYFLDFFLINTHNYYFLTVKFINAIVRCHLKMELKQSEGKSNSVTTD